MSAVVLGGGLAGMAAALALAEAGVRPVTIVERGTELGGLAGTFERDGRFYPLAYHHILHRDRTLLFVLARLGALERVRWRRIRMLFHLGGRHYDLGHPVDFLRFPMSLPDKVRFVRLMLRCFGRSDWSAWNGRSAAELVDRWAGPGVRRALFERLARLKFGLPCDEISGAWLGARLYFREGSSPLGYIPGTNWTKVLCEGLAAWLEERGVRVRLGTTVTGLDAGPGGIAAARVAGGERIPGTTFVAALPAETYRALAPDDATPGIAEIRYTAIVSAVCATRQRVAPDFYWMNLASLDYNACGLFRLESLNPTIGAPGETCLNFVTHVPHRDEPFFARDEASLVRGYADDFERLFGAPLEPAWWQVSRLPLYSPVFVRSYRNPPAKSERFPNLWFAGNYRNFPSIASTGTAIASGFEAARAALAARGQGSALAVEAEAFRPPRSA